MSLLTAITPLAPLVEALAQLPSLGPKTAERLAFYILKQPEHFAQRLADALVETKASVHPCPQCFTLTNLPLCQLCANPKRNASQLCVVVETSDVYALERTQSYSGLYHVLGGVLSPLDGVGVEQLALRPLFDRLHGEDATQGVRVEELILALPPTTEGDTTSLYISKQVEGLPIKLSRIAYGLPVGGHLDYADNLTLTRALQGRTQF